MSGTHCGCDWKKYKLWRDVNKETFSDYKWQTSNTLRQINSVVSLIKNMVSDEFVTDLTQGIITSKMNLRITPYLFSLINWQDPYQDPVRKQFLPLASEKIACHPYNEDDSLNEDADSPIPGLVHRYPDKVLFLPLTVCPIYCVFCTRSRMIGGSTKNYNKKSYQLSSKNWKNIFDYIRSNTKINDVLVSGGDAYMLTEKNLRYIGKSLLEIENVKRIRFATKGLSAMPMRITSDPTWIETINDLCESGRVSGKHVAIHTHINHPNEISEWTEEAMKLIFSLGITVRNQSVLLAGVNDNVPTMHTLINTLSENNIEPYYVYLHDMVTGAEHFRTTLNEAITISKSIRGLTAGFRTPLFVCDVLGGGGKRDIFSYENYDQNSGISTWRSPAVKPGKLFYYFDPVHKLTEHGKHFWEQNKLSFKDFIKQYGH